MGRLISPVNIVDIEATCWENGAPPAEIMEIIEIGICQVDIYTKEILNKRSIITRPISSTVSEFCTNLTTLTQDFINEHGIDFKSACEVLQKEYKSRKLVWGSYGDYDRIQFERNCLLHECDYPFSKTHINIKALFSIKHKLTKSVGMDKALNILHLPLEGTHHRGDDDAYNTARIFCSLMG